MRDRDIHQIIKILRREVPRWEIPYVTSEARATKDPFKVLISCILSLRTQNGTTAEASKRLFNLADNPQDMLRLKPEEIEKVIYPVGFYRNKARIILELSKQLLERYDSKVPEELEELLKLKGVGRKTANLVVTMGYGKLGICVDTHVHRISNRWGYIRTKNPEETEFALRKKLPQEYWIEYNSLLVSLGQHICRPLSPLCSQCPVERFCAKVGVIKRR